MNLQTNRMADSLATINASMQEQLGLPVNAHLINTAIALQSTNNALMNNTGFDPRYSNNTMGSMSLNVPMSQNAMIDNGICNQFTSMGMQGDSHRPCEEHTFKILVPRGGSKSKELYKLMQSEMKKEALQDRLSEINMEEMRSIRDNGVRIYY